MGAVVMRVKDTLFYRFSCDAKPFSLADASEILI
jgi:hypothetical protein